MNYISVDYVVFSALLLLVYYLFSRINSGKYQWMILLLGSVFFYYTWTKNLTTWIVFLIPVCSSYLGGILLGRNYQKSTKKLVLWISIILILFPFILFKIQGFVPELQNAVLKSIVAPLGISFFTLQLVAYVVDCYYGKINAQKNPIKHLLFVTFFPQIIQGPIPRYRELGEQLFNGHSFAYENLAKGMLKVVWGFFLKLMIADKAAIFVNNVFDSNGSYVGGYIVLAAVLYAIQLYTDFLSCTSISLGVAQMFGLKLTENFARPYFAVSVKDFWRRWHISLSTWLKDYIYIPLGGSRKGRIRKYCNILIVFLVSGLWHGSQYQFIIWGLLHAIYQVAGDLSLPIRERIYELLGIRKNSHTYNLMKMAGVFFWVTIGWVFFRSRDIAHGIRMIRDAFVYINPWSVWGTELFSLGLDYQEFTILLLSVVFLIIVSYKQEHGAALQEWFMDQHLILRWGILFSLIIITWVFGTYGYGFNVQDFIYGGF